MAKIKHFAPLLLISLILITLIIFCNLYYNHHTNYSSISSSTDKERELEKANSKGIMKILKNTNLAVLTKPLERGQDNPCEIIKKHQTELTELIDTVYNKYDNLSIDCPKDAKENLRSFLLSINVHQIHVYKDENGNKILELNLDTDGSYIERIIYWDHETEELHKCYKKIIPHWYYKFLGYT